MARTKTRATGRKPTVRMESRRERVRTERRELHPAVGSERCASQSPMVSLSPQSLRHSMTAWLTALSTRKTYGWQMGKITGMVTSATPRLVKKFNYRIVWADGSKRDRPSCKSTTMAMGHTLATTRGSS